ncbi:MAG: ATP-dependent zinc metalloprotease FtsH [Clostridia bacterium]|nr:ATP-dependent zinc metalloprotease FtsH [Clostridia bacterium]
MKSKFKVLLLYVALFAVIFFAVSVLFGGNSDAKEYEYSEIKGYFDEHRVTDAYLTNQNVLKLEILTKKEDGTGWVENSDGSPKRTHLEYRVVARAEVLDDVFLMMKEADNYNKQLPEDDVFKLDYSFNFQVEEERPWWLDFLPYIIILLIGAVLWFFMMRQATGGGKGGRGINSFGKARVKTPSTDSNKVRFADVAGADEEKAELEEVVEFLKNPGRFQKLGAKIPHGVLLVGPPGTGKTLLAKAVAGEAGVPFFSISGSDFVEMYVGVGASRVRDLFETARKAPASIVFIDEIDAVGRHRGAGLGGGHDEREQTLNQLLVEMDGFGSHDGIIVIAATNRPDILDPALLRPGRFDRQITVSYPSIKGREEILAVHAKNKPMGEDVDFAAVAKSTVGFTGADLANLLNEAALLAARAGKHVINMDDIEEAFIKIIAGPKKKSMVRSESEKLKTAYHEAGHAIIAYALPTCSPVQQISIIPSGRALGYTLNPPTEDKYSEYKKELCERIAELLGGRAAEKIIFDDISGGASNDIERATAIARKMVTKLGMSDLLGPIAYGTDQGGEVFLGRDFSSTPNYSEEVAAKIDQEIHRIIDEAYQLAIRVLKENIGKLHFVAEFLVKHELMDGDQFYKAMTSDATIEEIAEIAEEKRRKRLAESEERARREEERERRKKEKEERERAEREAAESGNGDYSDPDNK